MKNPVFSSKLLGFALASTLMLSACGGGGGGALSSVSSLISGVAATGVPVVTGTVTATDANGAVSPAATTDANGNYAVNVTGMTAPYVLTVTGGTVNGQPSATNIHSVALSGDIGGNVNITPLTDLMLARAAGVPGTTLENCKANGSCGKIQAVTNALLTTALSDTLAMVTGLKDQAGNPLAATVDLRKDPIKAGTHTGIDGILDQVSLDQPPALGATANLILTTTGTKLGSVALATNGVVTVTKTGPTANDLKNAANFATAAVNLKTELTNTITVFNSLYATAIPSAADIGLLLSSTYLNNGNNRAADINNLTTTPANGGIAKVGMSINGGALAPFDLSPLQDANVTKAGATATVAEIMASAAKRQAMITDANGCVTSAWVVLNVNGNKMPMRMSRTINAGAATPCTSNVVTLSNKSTVTWLIDGNQRAFASKVIPAYGYTAATAAGSPFNRMIQVSVNPVAGGPAIKNVTVQAQGLSAPVTMAGSATSPFVITNPGYTDNLLLSCADTAATVALFPNKPCFDNAANAAVGTVADGAVFVLSYNDPTNANALTYQLERLPNAPVAVTALAANMFPSGVAANQTLVAFGNTLATLAANATTSLTVTATLPSGYKPLNDIYFYGVTAAGAQPAQLAAATNVESIVASIVKPATPVTSASIINISVGGLSNGQAYFATQKMQ